MKSALQDRATTVCIDLKRDKLRHNCTNDVISEILPGISKLNFSGILLTISTKVRETFLFSKIDLNSSKQGADITT